MSQLLPASFIWLLFLQPAIAFVLYPPVDPDKLAKAYNVTTDCLQALNQTVEACDQTLFQMVGSVDNYYWQDDNITTLCSANCTWEATLWDLNVGATCDGQYFSSYGKLIPPQTISGRFVDGMRYACLGSTVSDAWCLTESQNWTGSDIYRPSCGTNSSVTACSGNSSSLNLEDQRMADLYDDDTLCDYCFIQMLYTRVTSQYLPDSDYSDYLVDQLQDIADVCNATIPDITVRELPTYPPAPPVSSVYLGNGTGPTTTLAASSANQTCMGQLVGGFQKRSHKANPHIRGESLRMRQTSSSCDGLSTTYGITTGDLQAITGSDTCVISASTCFPSSCTLKQVPEGTTCDALAQSVPGNVSTVQFLKWNPNILGLCDSPTPGQLVCIGAPGGTYSLPPPLLGTGADAGNQQRGGPGGVVTPTSASNSTSTTKISGAVSAPTATQSGIASNCNDWAQAQAGDDCYDFATAHGITPDELYEWNAILGANGANCSLQFQAGEYYCIGVSSSAATTKTQPAPATTTGGEATTTDSDPNESATTPAGSVQTGIAPDCDKYAEAQTGDTCGSFAAANSISTGDLFAWNSVLGSNGENCASEFWANEYYCVGVASGAATTSNNIPSNVPAATSTTSVTAPGPTQSGIASNCNKFAEAQSGDTCDEFATNNGISTDQLYAWNAILGSDGSNCSSDFWADEWYCVGVNS